MRYKPDQQRAAAGRIIHNATWGEERRRAAFVAVCLIGVEERVPRKFGDNAGVWPVKVVTTQKPYIEAGRSDRESPIHRVRVLDLVWTESKAHAMRLREALNILLLGVGNDTRELRHGWRDIDGDPAVTWAILLGEAIRMLADRREVISVMSQGDMEQRVQRRVERR